MIRAWFYLAVAAAFITRANSVARLVCYIQDAPQQYHECSHLVYTGDARGDKLDALLKDYKKSNPRAKIVIRLADNDKDIRTLLKSKHAQGIEVYDAHKSLNRSKVLETVEAARTAISSSGGGPLFLALPAHPELLAKYYDLRSLMKKVDFMMVQTHGLGKVKKMTYHPSRLSGLWDMMNTDSVVDLVVGLGVPASKIVISLPATAQQFTLQNETLSTPGSPTVEDEPKEIGQDELCRQLQKGRWTLERDQDLSAPYAFKNTTWIAFEDASSVDVKGKYARVRGLAGLALHRAQRDVETPCGPTLRTSLAKVLNQQSRAPRAVILRSLENEILSAPGHGRALDALQVSPYRITQIVDSDGVIHSIREDTRTEFSCSRQGYFVHPRSCARFYRCVKFDQLSPEYTVFEFDCPAGLAFDSRYEVCVWPGSLPDSQACPGSSEIAPVPQTRFVCPEHEGYYADPENCRWFFACLDHGKAPLTAYEFRCPFGLGFDAARLKCDWPWLVPACGNIARYEAEVHGYSGALLTGAAGFHGQTADSVNIAAHQSLVSGASQNNLVGIQHGFLTQADALDTNFIASQELANGANQYISQGAYSQGSNGLAYQGSASNLGLVQATKYDTEPKYTSGSIILDDYRLPTKNVKSQHSAVNHNAEIIGLNQGSAQSESYSADYSGQANGNYNGYSTASFSGNTKFASSYQSSDYDAVNSGAYVHDPSGDYAEPYKHVGSPVEPYIHQDAGYKSSSDYYDYGRYKGSTQSGYEGKYTEGNNGQYVHDNSGEYVEHSADYKETNGYKSSSSGAYNVDYSGSYSHDTSGQYVAGVYRADGHIGAVSGVASSIGAQSYSQANSGNYISDSRAFTGASHTLTAGAVNVGLVGKTTLVDAEYNNQNNYKGTNGYYQTTAHETYPGHVKLVSQPAVSISHVGTDSGNLDGYSYVTNPTSSGVPTTATPFASTTVAPTVSYKTTFVPAAPTSTIKQIFGFSQPAVTTVQPAIVAVQSYVTPKVQVTNHNEGLNYQYESKDYSGAFSQSQSAEAKESSGYDYSKPSIKFEDGFSYTTPSPISISTYKPSGFSHSQQTNHNVESVGYQYSTPVPVTEEPFKKIVAYTTGNSVSTYAEPTVASYPQSFSHQTIHKVESNNVHIPLVEQSSIGYTSNVNYEQPQTVVQYSTPAPAVEIQPVVSTYQPQGFSHQTLHNVEANRVNTYSQDSSSGYSYEKPTVQFEEGLKTVQTYSTAAPTFVQYSTPAPAVVTTYKPQTYRQQVLHKFESKPLAVSSTPLPAIQYQAHPAPVTVYENPIVQYTQPKITPITYEKPTYNTQSYSHQTLHKFEENKAYAPAINNGGYEYKSTYNYEQPKAFVQYTTSQPAIVQQQVVSTYQPQLVSHQTYHKVDANQVKTYSEAESGYQYTKPEVKFEGPSTVTYSTAAPTVVSTYSPKSYTHQTVHNVESKNYLLPTSTPLPAVDYSSNYQTAKVSTYENPILTYAQKVTPVTHVKPTPIVFSQTYQPIVQTHQVSHGHAGANHGSQQYYEQNLQLNKDHGYNQPEIQTYENIQNSYSDASVVSHQSFNLNTENRYKSGKTKDVVFVSTTPATLAYEDHYTEYEAPKNVESYKGSYITPKTVNQQSYSVVSTAAPIFQESYSAQNANTAEHNQRYDYESAQKVRVQPIAFSQSLFSQPRRESIHLSTFPGTKVTTKYQKTTYENPEIQVQYNAEEYLPPVVSTEAPVVTSTYKPRVYSTTSKEYLPPTTTREYLPPAEPEYNNREYLPPAVDNNYLPPSTTARPAQSTTYRAPEYVPPKESNVVSFESFGYNNVEASSIGYKPYQEVSVSEEVTAKPVFRKPNIVVETAKSNLLGFGTVGPDAGLVSPVTYTTVAPVEISSTYQPRKSSSRRPSYKYVESTTYKAPEYLPPSEETKIAIESYRIENEQEKITKYNPYQENVVVSTFAPIKRKQNIVVQTAKAQSQYKSDAEVVSPGIYSTTSIPSTEAYSATPQIHTSSYAPVEQGLYEVTSTVAPRRRTKPKVAVVTKINDFNPLLVRKLGAVCSCQSQSPVLVLKGTKINTPTPTDFDDYGNDYEDGRGDINDQEWAQKSARFQSHSITKNPVVTSTSNPIIVPDDSYYQDYIEQRNYESVAITPKPEVVVSSTPVITSTEKIVRIRPRVKSVTVAPTYQTVLLNQEVAPTADEAVVNVESQSFDRYGPGGWRSRDETLQGSVDCKRAGLFRHPKQCNKFYACRWDCTKQRFTLHVFNCPVQLSFDPSIGACNWPSQGPACQGDTLLTNTL